MDQEGHLKFFTFKSIQYLLNRHGFEVISIGSFGPEMDLFWRKQKRLARDFMRTITGDYFLGAYEKACLTGIWIRAFAKVA